jgi:hypothetical protein
MERWFLGTVIRRIDETSLAFREEGYFLRLSIF